MNAHSRAPHERPGSRKRFHVPDTLKTVILAVLAVGFFGLGAVVLWAAFVPIPSINNFEDRQVAQSTKIYDRTGSVVLYDVHGSVQRTSVPLSDISPYIQQATVATEDRTFYHNIGFDPSSFVRAFLADIFAHSFAQGGSTITQQVVKNALLTTNKSIARKIEEIILAIRLTRSYSKDQILNTYLNESPYGGTIYGVEEASQFFFGIPAKDVDLAQAAYIAALPQAPTYYSPYGPNRAALDARKNYILGQMLDQGYITQEQYKEASTEAVQFSNQAEANAGIKAPHFVFYIINYLEQKYGSDTVENGGLRVITTLDYDMQQHTEQIVSDDAPGMMTNFNASNTGVVVIDPKTGEILSMVGSADFFNNSIDGQVNVTVANRQPGSTFKPFVYAAAFEKGYTPSTVVFDLPTQFSLACAPQDNYNNNPPCYSPVNFDGSYQGPISLRDAIAISDNVASIKVLYLAGIQNAVSTAEAMGITTLGDPSQYGLSLVLGGGGVTLLQMTGAYGVFANDGIKNEPVGVMQVTDQSGNVLEQYQPAPARVLDPQVARQVNDILSDNVARTPEFGANGPLEFDGYDVADKTGTTDNSRDAWVIGYDPNVVVGEWAGNNDNSPMVKRIAAFIVAPTWHKILAYALSKYSSTNDTFPAPAPNPNYDSLPPVLKGNWNSNPLLGVHDILYWVQRDNPTAGAPANPFSDPQASHWDYSVQQWAASQGLIATSTTATSTTPTAAI
jgi:1A family penicillin-binding protein